MLLGEGEFVCERERDSERERDVYYQNMYILQIIVEIIVNYMLLLNMKEP